MTPTERALLRALNEAAAALAVIRNSARVPEHVKSFARECFDDARQAALAFDPTEPTWPEGWLGEGTAMNGMPTLVLIHPAG